MKVLITGAGGLLGRACKREFSNHQVAGLCRNELDISDEYSIFNAISQYKPDVMVNCAAATNVDMCEASVSYAYSLNTRAPRLLADCCKRHSIKLIHISTDYVFPGSKGNYYEDDRADPLSVYGTTKYMGEQMALGYDALVLRTQWLYGEGKKSFIDMVLNGLKIGEVKAVCDCKGALTYAGDLARVILRLAEEGEKGLYHAEVGSCCTWEQIAQFIANERGSKIKITPILERTLKRPAPRPKNCILKSHSPLTTMPTWEDSLKKFLLKL